MKKLLVVLLLCMSGLVHAHEGQPRELNDKEVAMIQCQGLAMNAAWGAYSNFMGAPEKFIYHPKAEMKKMWDEQKVDYSQGIHGVETDNLELEGHSDLDVVEILYDGGRRRDNGLDVNIR